MKKLFIILIVLCALGGASYYAYTHNMFERFGYAPVDDETKNALAQIDLKKDLITVSSPMINQKISSPTTVTGSARGTWYFEASFPVMLLNEERRMIANIPAQAQGEWMTEDFVPYTATLRFPPQRPGSKGYLLLRKDNPSGDPAKDAFIEIPVKF